MVSPAPLRVVFFGTPDFAVPTLDALLASTHPVVAVVTQPDRPRGRGQKVSDSPVKARAAAAHLPVLQPASLRDRAFVDPLAKLAPDIGVVAAYGRLLTDELLSMPRLGFINVHASLLPKYRGAAPIHRAILAGDVETGVTIMRVVKALDAGPMIAKSTRAIGPNETSEDVERALAAAGAELLVSTMSGMAAGTACEEPQNDAEATYAPRLTREDGIIDWQRSAAEIHNQIRGLFPWPHAFSFVGGRRIIFWTSDYANVANPSAPGTIVEVGPDRLRIATGSGVLTATRLQLEGKRPMAVRELLAGHTLTRGSRFAREP